METGNGTGERGVRFLNLRFAFSNCLSSFAHAADLREGADDIHLWLRLESARVD